MKSNTIAKNTAFITIALISQKIISFVYFTLIARHVGAGSTGKYFFALSFTTILVVFIDLGLTNVLIRESSRLKGKIQEYFSNVIFAKIFFGVLTYITAILVIKLMNYPIETKHLVYLSAVTMLFDSLQLTIYGILRAIGNLKYEAIGIVGSQFLTLILGTSFLYLNFSLIFLILAFTIPSFLNVCYATFVLYKKYNIKLKPKYEPEVLKFLFKIAWPFALAAIFARVYSYIDSILLSKLVGDVALGWYSISYKITYSFQFIPLALMAVLYPRFSEYFISNKERLAYLLERSLKYLLIIVFPIIVGISILAHDIIISIYTIEYLPSILPLQILLVGLLFSYISFPLGAFLNACNRQITQTIIIFIVMVLNIILNLILIPIYGAVGAAISALMGNILLTILGYIIIPKIIKISHIFLLKTIFQLLIAVIIMGLTVWYINSYFNWGLAILAGAIIYPLFLIITRTITKKQIKEVFVLIKR